MLWMKDGNLVVNADGLPVDCDECPYIPCCAVCERGTSQKAYRVRFSGVTGDLADFFNSTEFTLAATEFPDSLTCAYLENLGLVPGSTSGNPCSLTLYQWGTSLSIQFGYIGIASSIRWERVDLSNPRDCRYVGGVEIPYASPYPYYYWYDPYANFSASTATVEGI